MIKTVGIDKEILVTDDLQFVLETKDSEDCLITPYQITNVTIYFVNREFTDSTASEYKKETKSDDLAREYENIKQQLCKKLKDNVNVASTSNLNLFGLQIVDGIQLKNNDRVLVKDQIQKQENGIYQVSDSNWTRSKDANSSDKVVSGMYVFSENGIQNISKGWVLDTNNPIVLGETELDFICFSVNGTPSSPDQNSIELLNELKAKIENSKKTSSFFYKDAKAVKTVGGLTDLNTGELFPAWLNPDFVSGELREKVSQDNFLLPYEENDKIIEGKFILNWSPIDCREGDYFICWTWKPNLGENTLSAHQYFSLYSNTSLTTSIPTHRTYPKKYEILLDRYLPEMFKTIISDGDLSPKVLKGLNDSVARGFTVIEDMANQIIDLFDANATHETLLPLLSNLFNLKLKSTDSTLWRRQIKKAIPNFKKKGSILGLKEALGDIGMKLNKITRLWQVKSNYTHQEHFEFKDSNVFKLSKKIIVDSSNLELYLRIKNGNWLNLTGVGPNWHGSFVSFDEENNMTWVGQQLEEGDSLRILYKFRNIPLSEQSKEEYIRSLPLLDQRDEKDQDYPPKNWNIRGIEEDDVYFDLLVPVKHPFSDPIIWGRVRTEFPYSENAYNMDEYNGSKRDSLNPCDIDKEFIDNCGQCQSSKFNLYLEVERLSNESFIEVQNTIEEYMPFHSSIHTFDLSGAVTEFIRPSVEKIDVLLKFATEDVLLAGEGQDIFNRDLDFSDIESVQRDLLSSYVPISNGPSTNWGGVIKNQKMILLSSTTNSESELNNFSFKNKTQGFEKINVSTNNIDNDNPFESDNLLEILGSQTKFYTVADFKNGEIEIEGNVESSLIGPVFEYRISNKIADLNVNISRADQIIFKDDNADFYMLGIVTQYDVENGDTRDAWKLRYLDKEYSVINILPDGTLSLKEENSITPIVGWELVDGDIIVKPGTTGSIEVFNYGLVEINSPEIEVREKLKIGDYLYLNWSGVLSRYLIKSFKQGENKFYIADYSESNLGGELAKIYRRILENKVGQLGYKGLELKANDNLENILNISNGINKNLNNINYDNIKENYLIFSDSKYYSILEVDGSNLTLNGPHDDFGVSGQEIDFMVLKFEKQNLEISAKVKNPFLEKATRYQFKSIDRAGGSIITNTESTTRPVFMSTILNSSNNNPVDYINQSESIDFDIEYKE
jgi:hypothetical protein